MILPRVVIPSRQNQHWQYSGMDSPDLCANKTHFHRYPYTVEYHYNSRGFRDEEWPDNVEACVWCVGDSFTVGLGAPREHTWSYILGEQLGKRTLNVSMDGASNTWIRRQAVQILELDPELLILQWSYITRREATTDQLWQKFYASVRDPSWPECETYAQLAQLPEWIRNELETVHNCSSAMENIDDTDKRLRYTNTTDEQDKQHLYANIEEVENAVRNTCVIHSFVPYFSPNGYDVPIPDAIRDRAVPEFAKIDLARDGHHYDRLTAEHFVQSVVQLVNQ